MAVVRDQPYTGQNFLVDLGDGNAAAFSEVSGLSSWIEVTEYREGSDRESNRRKIPSLTKVADVTLKRGITGSLNLYQWFDQVRNGDRGAVRTVTITLLSEDRTPVLTWRLLRARPVGYAAGPLDAGACDVAVEELVLAYERLELE